MEWKSRPVVGRYKFLRFSFPVPRPRIMRCIFGNEMITSTIHKTRSCLSELKIVDPEESLYQHLTHNTYYRYIYPTTNFLQTRTLRVADAAERRATFHRECPVFRGVSGGILCIFFFRHFSLYAADDRRWRIRRVGLQPVQVGHLGLCGPVAWRGY